MSTLNLKSGAESDMEGREGQKLLPPYMNCGLSSSLALQYLDVGLLFHAINEKKSSVSFGKQRGVTPKSHSRRVMEAAVTPMCGLMGGL